ncbi:MAG: translation initiation factor IF-2 [Clostridia bacterium]|nr:translation initiation factor IF-2 [Clostridia bacterium]
MEKIKIHELAKKLNKSSKEIMEMATKFGAEIKSHLSTVEADVASKIEKEMNNKGQSGKEKSNSAPVIIRREVIISDEELAKKEEEKKAKQEAEKRKDVGFVERNKNKEYNIVYRDKPSKPMTASELFGLKPKKEEVKVVEEEKTKEEVKQEIKEEVKQEEKVIETKPEVKSEIKQEKIEKPYTKPLQNTSNTHKNHENRSYGNKPKYDNNRRNFGDNRFGGNNYNRNEGRNDSNSRGPRNERRDDRQNGNNGNFRNNQNRRQGGYGNNNSYGNNGGFRNNNRMLDERGIEKNIKNIMSQDIVEKDNTRDYNRTMTKQKNNSRNSADESRQRKSQRTGRSEDFDSGKLRNLKQENKLSNMFSDPEGGMYDYYDLTTVRGKRGKKKNNPDEERTKQKIFKLTEITIPDAITVKDLAQEMKKTTAEIIKKLLDYGIMATLNNEIDFDTAFLIAQDFGITAKKKEIVTEEDILFDDTDDREEDLQPRPPVVVVMGHVDHGKTSLLDAVRSTNVIEGEAGGITQHIGAYKVEVNGREITFLDTPGHEAFTSMRARGAQVTDIAILVVAANDGVMPQTVEAINHAKNAGIPIIVAINKIDVEGANPEKVKQELMKYELVPEEWGGDTVFVEISAKKRINIDGLLEMVLLVADVAELKANPDKQSKGVVIEARLDKTRGPIATMLVQRGTLDVGDTVVVGSVIGRIRAMMNDKGKKVKKAGPSTPVEIIGLTEVPEAGETFYEVDDEKTAKHLIERRKRQEREKSINASSKVSLNDLFSQIEKNKLKQLNLIVKADVQGSVEAVTNSLEKISNDEVKVKVIHSNVGGVTESDVTLAKVANAIIIAFNVRPEPIAKEVAKKEEIEIKQYSVIYKAIEDVESAMKGMLDPTFEEKVIGNAEIRQTFKVSNIGTIAGCYVLDGKVTRNAGVRVIRDNVVIHEGKLASLKRFKDDVKEVVSGYECGLQIENYNDLIEGDTLEVFVMEEVKK